MRPPVPQDLQRRILKDGLRRNDQRDEAFRRIIRSVPKGKVSTYGKVAAAAGYPLYHRAVARLLRNAPFQGLPWQRIVGAGGEIKLRGEAAAEQRLRLTMEGVRFRGKRVKIVKHVVVDFAQPNGGVEKPISTWPDITCVKVAGTLPVADRKSTRLNSSHSGESRMPSSA